MRGSHVTLISYRDDVISNSPDQLTLSYMYMYRYLQISHKAGTYPSIEVVVLVPIDTESC